MSTLTVEERFPIALVQRAIEQSRDLSGYMVWPVVIEARVNAAADEVTGLCWVSTSGPTGATWLSCLRPTNHDGECGWEPPLATLMSGVPA